MRTKKAFKLLDKPVRYYLAKIINKCEQNGPWRIPSIAYTLEHKLAILEVEHYLTGSYSLRGLFHDWEKPFLFLVPWLDKKKIQKMHRKLQPHHMDSKKQTCIEHLFEMYLDWSSAAITKPDKPLNAFATLVHFYPDYIRMMLPVCLTLGAEEVRPEIYLHASHKLNQDESHNAKVYHNVLQVLRQIRFNFACNNDLWDLRLDKLEGNLDMSSLTPDEIFMLAAKKQAKNFGKKVNIMAIQETLDAIIRLFEQRGGFSMTQNVTPKFDYKEVKSCPYLE